MKSSNYPLNHLKFKTFLKKMLVRTSKNLSASIMISTSPSSAKCLSLEKDDGLSSRFLHISLVDLKNRGISASLSYQNREKRNL